MLISKHWLEQFVDISDIAPEDLAEQLTLHTVEIEGTLNLATLLDHIVVGEVVSIEKHPDANLLHVCQVSVGKERLQVVCGGSNVRQGMKVAMGMLGAKVRWHGEGDPIELAKIKIRGQESFGMICAADEIGLGDLFRKKDEKEILDVTDVSADAGTPLSKALGLDDIVLEVDNKSMTHRPDLWGHYGIAREIAAIYDLSLREYITKEIEEGDDAQIQVSIKDGDMCRRYMGVVVQGISIGPSPDWLQHRLAAVGINPINNVVDITNYVMAELGQPMHAFDADTLHSNDIVVRRAKKGESIVTLGGDEHQLTSDMLVIADKKKPIAIAGIKGGDQTGVTQETTTIIFEAANFDATGIRKAASTLGLRTDASSRFEKSLDPSFVELAMKRAVELTLEIIPDARVASPVADAGDWEVEPLHIRLRLPYLRERIGVDVARTDVVHTLEQLGFSVDEKGNELELTVPSWRATKDVSIEEDVIEEIARMYGYNMIPVYLPKASIQPAPENQLKKLTRSITKRLAYEAGYIEVYNYSFISPEWLAKMNIATDTLLELDNPIAKDRPFLRRNLFPNMLLNVEQNLHRYNSVQLFEIGKIYEKEEPGDPSGIGKERLPRQDVHVGMVYAAKGDETPFFALADAVRLVLGEAGVAYEFEKSEADADMIHPGRSARVVVEGVDVGKIAELHPLTQEKLGIPFRTAIAQINLNEVLRFAGEHISYVPLGEYPSVERDIAFVVDSKVEHAEVLNALQECDALIAGVSLFDVYGGQHVPEGKKSMAYHITYLSRERTLTAEEVDTVHATVVQMLRDTFGAEVRA
ncbi:MAG: phenylalanine--tRNA ligase subunit beta [Candidatus Magasanikbacteria bacterium CG10_big_fil_rev_8_21_14_0_10_47_10]|uniref:Phenylalanine--tRNA ligase beta subunit n=1 Tax=Candidatus Magasanikbacteria bacterium CG10_big_fil_rev_8_21_14_0_10_47_10 TaxID=1974652 RepID=A0A2H0TQM0_9BACT|nr:MAG: phenylalanine--tRNA ligase subunit beta [Candidatus Magasanikbacteria bacterium CG10_big_fil_rev_8_21_14_0_10_47_10]